MTLESQGRCKILVQLVGDKRKTRIPIIFWEKSMSNKTKLYENLKNETIHIAYWQDLRHSLIRKREKNKVGTSYKNNSSSEKEQKYHGQTGGDNKFGWQGSKSVCSTVLLLLLIFYKLTRAFCGEDKSCWPVGPSQQRHSLTAFSSAGTRPLGQQMPVPGLGGYARTERCPVLYIFIRIVAI